MRGRTVFLAVVLPLVVGCGGGAKQAETPPRAPGPPVPIRSFLLFDADALYGGYVIWAVDRTAIIQVLGPPPAGHSGLWEKRYQFKLTAEQWGEVERLVGAHHLLAVKIPDQPSAPHEARPVIMVVSQAGTTNRVRKRGRDTHPDFDPVYEYIRGLYRTEGTPVFEGEFDGKWLPDGFADPWK